MRGTARFQLTKTRLVVALALIAVVAIAVPALGGSAERPRSAQQTAQQALAIANQAKRQVAALNKTVLKGLRVVDGPTFSVNPGDSTVDAAGLGGFKADCPRGHRVVGTGWEGDFGDMWRVTAYTFFVGGFGTNDASIPGDFQLQAICTQTNAPLSRAAERSRRAAALREYRADSARAQARWAATR